MRAKPGYIWLKAFTGTGILAMADAIKNSGLVVGTVGKEIQ